MAAGVLISDTVSGPLARSLGQGAKIVALSGDATVDADGVVTVSGVSASGMSDLASTANGKGASLIGVEDSAALLSGATVEAVLAELAKYAPISLTDPGTGQAIPVTRSATINIVTGASGETNTLAIPTRVGDTLRLHMKTDGGGDRVITSAQAINQAGNTIMTFGAVRDFIVLVAVDLGGALRWQVAYNDGVALS